MGRGGTCSVLRSDRRAGQAVDKQPAKLSGEPIMRREKWADHCTGHMAGSAAQVPRGLAPYPKPECRRRLARRQLGCEPTALCKVIGEPTKLPAKVSGEPIKIGKEGALRKELRPVITA